MIVSFSLCLLAFVVVGLLSFRKSESTKKDYYLASSSVAPSLVGLSAVATNNSGYMFIGVIGYTYSVGLTAVWLMVGWILGDFIASLTVYTRIRKVTGRNNAMSYSHLLSGWHGTDQPALQKLIAIISLVFLLTYASAQLLAGSKALYVLLDWPIWAGAVMGAIMVALYCVAGGIRASIWTDAAQSVVMIFAMALLLIVGIVSLGGISSTVVKLSSIEGFLNLAPAGSTSSATLNALLFFVGWLFAGFSVSGQPHVMVRFMTLNSTSNMRRAKIWYYLWFIAFYFMATGVGMLARIYIEDTSQFDAELALPSIAQQLLPPYLVGIILAGIFAATMSTADSLLLSCSSALTHDLFPSKSQTTAILKVTTVALTMLALIIALNVNESVFNLVIMAWSGLGSAFVPLLLVLCSGGKPSQRASIVMVICGFMAAYLWRYAGWHAYVYEGLPGILVGLAVWGAIAVASRYTKNDQPD